MAAPNIRNPTNIIGKTVGYANVPTSLTNMLDSVPTDRVYKVNSIFAANRNGSNSSTISITIFNGSTDVSYLAYTIIVPADATQIISTKETYFYLEEGYNIRAQSGNSNHIDVTISYEVIYN